ncbi:MAG: 5'/3'-nucleotidase SurE [Dehalococcoidia bacterium]
MKILVSNDDGVDAPGLWAAAESLRPAGEVVVVAPDREQSGVGTAVTLHGPVRIRPVAAPVEGVTAFAVEGTPADSVIVALERLVGPVDLVVSGINQGANLGEDVVVSGTVGAALQGYVRGVNAIAISVTSIKKVRLEVASRLLRLLAPHLGEDSLPRPLFLNINLPNEPLHKIQGIKVTRMGQRSYLETVKEGRDSRRTYYWISRNRLVMQEQEGTDVWAVKHSHISITPLQVQLTAHQQLPALQELCQALNRGLRPR